jgi:L-ascorbate metabolism protein UlaG (beta-lactamase superfamily)
MGQFRSKKVRISSNKRTRILQNGTISFWLKKVMGSEKSWPTAMVWRWRWEIPPRPSVPPERKGTRILANNFMKITKFGHCCLLIEESGVRILTDPGIYSTKQNEVSNIDFVLITHAHADHFHIDSLKALLKNNPQAKVMTNKSVGELLKKDDIAFSIIEDGHKADANGVLIEGFGKSHALMHTSIPPIQNTGYFIANKFFYPGDAFTDPKKQVEVLALPVAGPWMRLLEAIDYALVIKPKACFPVHEGILKQAGPTHTIPPKVLEPKGIKFVILDIDKEYEF